MILQHWKGGQFMSDHKVTMRELSEYCGYSTATISRVINNTGRFSEETRARVLKAIDELGYIMDTSAQSLRTRSTRIVGIFINELNHMMTSRLLTQLQKQLFAQGYTPIICEVGYDGSREQYYFNMLQSINACAVLVIMKRMGSDCLLKANIPVLFVYRNPLPGMMEPQVLGGHKLFDGGIVDGAGIPLHLVRERGFKRLMVIATRPKGYRKKEPTPLMRRVYHRIAKGDEALEQALQTRNERYNESLDELDRLEEEGCALVVRPRVMPVKSTTIDRPKLEDAYAQGHAQGVEEWPRWEQWLFG